MNKDEVEFIESIHTQYMYEDPTITEAGSQVLCDTKVSHNGFTGYYLEIFNSDTNEYNCYYIQKRGDQIFEFEVDVEDKTNAKDIALAVASDCFYVY